MQPLVISVAAFLCTITPLAAQVTVDLNALDRLPNAKTTAPRAGPQPPPRPNITLSPLPEIPAPKPVAALAVPHPRSETPQPRSETLQPRSEPPANPPPPKVEQSGPARSTEEPLTTTAAIARPSTPPPAPPKPAMASVRVPFSENQAELSADGAAMIKGLVDSAPTADSVSFNVVAYATGSQDDPSTARRLSLSRALAARGALLGNGIPSSRIFVRALGSQSGEGPPDRVDISIPGGNAPASQP